MSVCVSGQMFSYVRSLYEHPSKWYNSYQENGTKYLKSRKILEDQLQQQLNACVGEIFLCGIPADTKAEKIAEIASLVGEVYILRFKVHFSGASRGFAYLQYINPNLMQVALHRLPLLFRELSLPMIKVCKSRNSSKLLLRKTFDMTPMAVFETLTKLVSFEKLVGNELHPGYFEYQIIFKCNEQAVHARREILKSILKFGPKAIIVWDNNTECRNVGTNFDISHGFNSVNMEKNLNINTIPKLRRSINHHHPSYSSKQREISENILNNFKNMNLV